MNHAGEGEARLVERANGVLRETDALISLKYRSEVAAAADGDQAVALAKDSGNVGDFEASRLAGIDRAAKQFETFHEKRADKVGLKAAGLGLLHFLLHSEKAF